MIAESTHRRGPGRPPAGGEDTRERILAEALRLFSPVGFHGTSLAEIGRAAGVTKATVLHHFDSKEALFVELLRRRDAGDGAKDATGAGTAVPTPREFLDGWLRLVAHNETTPELVALYASMSVGALDAANPAHVWIREHWDTTVASIVRVLEEGKAAGLVRPEAPSERLARLVVATADGLQLQWLGARADALAGVGMVAETAGVGMVAETAGVGMVAETRELLELIAARWFLD